jgi:hypothetical protein
MHPVPGSLFLRILKVVLSSQRAQDLVDMLLTHVFTDEVYSSDAV